MGRDDKSGQNGFLIGQDNASELTFLGRFHEAGRESAFRAHYLPNAVGQLRLLCFLLAGAVAIFTVNDVRMTGDSSLGTLLIVRVGVVLYVIGIAFAAPRARSAASLDWLGTALGAPFLLVMLWVDSTRPPGYFVHIGTDILTLLGVYFALPIGIRLRLFLAVLHSAGLFALFLLLKTPQDSLSLVSVLLAILFANGLGIAVSIRLERSRRNEFALSQQEHDARIELEKALSDVKTLSGMIPICAHCKKVRNDTGFWEQVEVFVRDHTNANFSHGICPECMGEYESDLRE